MEEAHRSLGTVMAWLCYGWKRGMVNTAESVTGIPATDVFLQSGSKTVTGY